MPKDDGVRRRLGRIAALAAAVPLLALAPAATAGAQQQHVLGDRLTAIAARPDLPAGTTEVAPLAFGHVITGAVGLAPRNEGALETFLEGVTNEHSPLFHHYLSKGQYASRFGATSSTIGKVTGFLRSYGLETGVSANHILVTFTGPAWKVERAFSTGLAEYRFADGGTGYGTTTAVSLPARLAAHVTGVAGLDDLVHDQSGALVVPRSVAKAHAAKNPLHASALPRAAAGAPSACSAATSQSIYGGVTDDQLAHAYGVDGLYSAGDLASGQTVDVFELEPFLLSDVQAFDQCYFGANETNSNHVNVIPVDGGAGTGPGEGEAALDVEDVSAIAPDATIDVYEGSNTTFGSLDTYNTIATADNASVVTSSWGLCESAFQQGAPGTQQIESEIFAETAAQGQSVFAAAGDDGSDDCAGHDDVPVANNLSVDDPASQPYVTAVGGTTFTNITEPPGEVVWNDGSLWGAGGGGVSDTWAEPSWQSDATVAGISDEAGTGEQPCSDDPDGTGTDYNLAGEPTSLASGTPCRLVPDVTALADEFTGITIVYEDEMTTIGGTSSATPLWAAMTAEMDASSYCSSGGLGFISPLLYDVASESSATYAEAFNDITVGNNDNLTVGNGTDFSATTGYDLASGLGSPRITNTNGDPGLAQLACALVASADRPAVTKVDPDSGPAAGNTSVTITGSNFGTTTGAVYFGTQAAAVDSWSATSITVTSPNYNAPQGTGYGAAGSAPVTVVVPSGAGEVSSGLGADSVFHYLNGATGDLPAIDYVGPTAGPAAGGNVVTIIGSGFTSTTTPVVTFGGADATDVSVNSTGTQITATVPAEPSSSNCAFPSDTSICQVEVQVTTSNGVSLEAPIEPAYSGPIEYQNSGVLAYTAGTEVIAAPTEYDYAPTPDVTSVTPQYGAEEGGSEEDIQGSGFNVLTYFWTDFGTVGPTSSQDFDVLSISPTDLWIVNTGDPSLTGPTVEPLAQALTIVTAAGDYTVSSSLFALAGIPDLTGLSSHYGSTEGGAALTLTGSGLSDVEEVLFFDDLAAAGGTETDVFTSQSDTSLTIVTPANLALATEVSACTETGCSENDSSSVAYTYGYPETPVISGIAPSSGPAAGGASLKSPVVISGTYLDSVVGVKFGSVQATVFENNEGLPGGGQAYQILVLPPPGKAGTKVSVTVETAGGLAIGHGTSNAVSYTYEKSAPSAPLNLRAVGGKGTIAASWAAPASNGGETVTSYVAELVAKGQKTVKQTVKGSVTKAIFTGVKSGIKWTVEVYAVNSLGNGYSATYGPVTAS